ncbi:acyl-CoA thioesterase [Heyndrickxia sp. NPDC080065]|uniref:acyl-CoA thioesterase n=1 Tax=Heyndrickxia sp. NPDC080065 TaxID=3390568 RepID=UPI003D027D72
MFNTEMIVRFKECDSLGHVNNATYLTYFEEARSEIFQIFNPNLSISSWNLIVASTQCDYIREMVYAQNFTVYTWISRIGQSSFDVEHAIKDEHQNWVARGKVVLAGFDFKHRKTVPLTKEIQNRLLKHNEGPLDAPTLR